MACRMTPSPLAASLAARLRAVFAGDRVRPSSGSASLDAKRQAHEARQLAEAAAVIDEGLAETKARIDFALMATDGTGTPSELRNARMRLRAALAALTPTPEAKP
jgi:hypothetical protein